MVDPNKPEKDDLNTPTNAEQAYKVGAFITKATAGVLAPVGGGVLSAAFDLIVTDPAVRRKDKFLMDVDERLTEMEEAGLISVEDLENNEEISSLLLKSVQTATRSSGEQKLKALKEIVVKGITAKEAASASQAQVMLALVDRMTEYHIIALNWHSLPTKKMFFSSPEKNNPDGIRESYHFGQQVFESSEGLIDPVVIHKNTFGNLTLYVERSSKVTFNIAEADLIALGLTKHVYKNEEYREGRDIKRRQTNTISGTEVTELGKHFLRYVGLLKEKEKKTFSNQIP